MAGRGARGPAGPLPACGGVSGAERRPGWGGSKGPRDRWSHGVPALGSFTLFFFFFFPFFWAAFYIG